MPKPKSLLFGCIHGIKEPCYIFDLRMMLLTVLDMLEKYLMKLMSLPNTALLFLFGVCGVVLLGQLQIISSQGQQIQELLTENADLRSSLAETEEKIDELLATQADIRNFQQELDRWVKTASFGPIKKFRHLLGPREQGNAQVLSLVQSGEASPSIRLAKLELAAGRAKYDVSSLLGEALSIKNSMLTIPTLIPTHGHISSHFGHRVDPFSKEIKKHNGIDFRGKAGTPIYASAKGRVRYSKFNRSYGNMIEIDHGQDLVTRYAHLARFLVKEGDLVEQGQQIATMGQSGARCQGTHLHYEILHKKRQLNPKSLMVMSPPDNDHLL